MKKLLSMILCLIMVCSMFAFASAEGETVTILTRYATYDNWDKIVELIEQKTGVTINTVTATTEYSDYCTKINSALAIQDDSYDIIDVDELLGVAYISAGYLEPITEVVEKHGENYLGSWLENISKGEEDYYLVPSGYSGIYLYANKTLFQEAGLAYPTNLEEFLDVAQKLTDAEKGVYGLGSAWMQGGYMFNDIQRLIKAFNGDFYDFDNEGTRKAIQFMYDQVNTYGITPVSAISEDYNAENQKFADGKYAMIFQWQNAYSTCQHIWENFEILPIPTFDSAATIMNSWGFGINTYSKNKEAAKKVLDAFMEEDVQMLTLGIEYTQHAGVLASEEASVDPTLVALGEYGQAGVISPREMPVYVNEIQAIMETNISAYISGQMSLEDCCANINFGFEDLM